MNEVCYVVYSHSDFLDVLSIQTDYLKSYTNKILLINKSNKNLFEIYSNYKNVIFYDDLLPYASRLLSLSLLDEKYILLIHDIDIIIKKDDKVINWFIKLMEQENIDRIDLQVRYEWDKNNIMPYIDVNSDEYKFLLKQQQNINTYIYNVNPSIWKLSSLIELMSEFNKETYRTIEIKCQEYCKKYKIYKLFSEKYINCGWFSCLPFFQYIHITHRGKLFNNSENKLSTHLIDDYKNIISKLINTRTFYKK